MPTLTELAEHALVLAKQLDEYTASNGLPPVSLEQDTLADLPQNLRELRHELGDTAQMMKRVACDPVRNLMETMFSVRGSILMWAHNF